MWIKKIQGGALIYHSVLYINIDRIKSYNTKDKQIKHYFLLNDIITIAI